MIDNTLVKGFLEDKDDSLKINLEKVPDVKNCIIINLNGYVDTYNSAYFQKQMGKIIEANFVNIICNSYNLNYVSSTGIGLFTDFLKMIKEKGGDLVLLNVQPKVYEVFQLLGFSQLFNFKENLNDSVEFFKKREAGGSNVFPKVLSCPVCSHRLKATKSGRFRCAECKSIISIDEGGNAVLG